MQQATKILALQCKSGFTGLIDNLYLLTPVGLYLAGCCGSVTAALGSSLASSEGTGAAAGVAVGAEAGVEAVAGTVAAGAAVDVEPESCKGGLGGSEAGGVAAVEGLAFQKNKSPLIVKTPRTRTGVRFGVDVFHILTVLTLDTITTTKFFSSILYSLIGVSSWRIFPAYINF